MIEKVNGNMLARIYGMDFRGRNDEETILNGETSMYLASLVDETSYLGDDGISFFDAKSLLAHLRALASKTYKSDAKHICVYVFDLAVAWSFLYPVLLEMGFKYNQALSIESQNECCAFSNNTNSIVWNVEIKFDSRDGVIFLKDISRVYTGFSSMYDMARDFGIDRPFYERDLDKKHPQGEEIDPLELVDSYSLAMSIMDILFAQKGNSPFFQASTLASYSFKLMLRQTFGWCNAPYMVFRSKKFYPQIEDEKEEEAVRASVFGGLTGATIYASRKKEINQKMFMVDARQMYPSVMCQYFMPCGRGTHHEGKFTSHAPNLSLFRVRIYGYDYPIIHSLPYLMQKQATFLYQPVDLWIWDFELALAQRCYENFRFEILETWSYKGRKMPWADYLKSNWENRCFADDLGDKSKSNHFKHCNNVIFGKLIQKPKLEDFESILDSHDILTTTAKTRKNQKKTSYSYSPAGSCLSARGRWVEIMTALKFGAQNIMYMDTDSLFVVDNAQTRSVLKTLNLKKELGGWKLTEGIERAFFPMAKRYKYEQNGITIVKGSGFSFDAVDKTNFEEIKLTEGEVEVRMKRQIKGGIIREKVKKRLGD